MTSLIASVLVAQTVTAPAIVPRPVSLAVEKGSFQLNADTHVVASKEVRQIGEQLRGYLRPATGYSLDVVGRGAKNVVSLSLDSHLKGLGDEGYRLEVRPDRVTLKASATPGLFYGIQTLRQLLPPSILRRSKVEGADWSIPCVTIEDHPRFVWRGGMIDSSRHFMPKDGILKFIDMLALHKMNTLHWHLTDDNGWRLEIKKYPKLTSVGAWRPESLPDYDPPKSPLHAPGGFYTQEDIREIVAYANERFVTVVPEIEVPGHSQAAIASYPEIGTGKSNVLNAEESTVQFYKDVLDEVMALFPGKFIHIGGDEVDKSPWHNDPRSQELIKERGLKDEEELQSWMIRQMDAYISSKGRRLIGWDEILEGGLASGAAVMSWRSTEGGVTAAKSGHDAVMAPTSNTYLDYYQGDPGMEPRAIGGFVPLETAYALEPVAEGLTPEEAKHILGCQGQLWAEYIPNIKHLEYMAWPRLAAIGEVGWSPKEGKDYKDFEARVAVDLQRLTAADVNFRPLVSPYPDVAGLWSPTTVSTEYKALEWDVSKRLADSGAYEVKFTFMGGRCRLDIQWVELLEDGNVVAREEHPGVTGAYDDGNVYRLNLGSKKEGAKYVLRASVRADGGHDSSGFVRLAAVK